MWMRGYRGLRWHGVGVYFQNDNINTFDKDAELRLTIMPLIAQENHVLLGQNKLHGYNKVNGCLEVIESEAAIIREVFERYTAGDLGLRAIANDQKRRA